MSKHNQRYIEAAEVECAGLDRAALIRMIAALSRRLDSEARRAYSNQRAYERVAFAAPEGEGDE